MVSDKYKPLSSHEDLFVDDNGRVFQLKEVGYISSLDKHPEKTMLSPTSVPSITTAGAFPDCGILSSTSKPSMPGPRPGTAEYDSKAIGAINKFSARDRSIFPTED